MCIRDSFLGEKSSRTRKTNQATLENTLEHATQYGDMAHPKRLGCESPPPSCDQGPSSDIPQASQDCQGQGEPKSSILGTKSDTELGE